MTITKDNIFKVEQITIKDICDKNFRFIIPVYQRPYVWDEIQINKLLEDLRESCRLESDYYVGNIYVTERQDVKKCFDVIDGQQRFTTFWLISLYFKSSKSGIEKFIQTEHHEIRLSFDIRTEVINYLNDLVGEIKSFDEKNLENEEFLKYISRGIKTIDSFFRTEEDQSLVEKMAKFIYERVKFIFNEAPQNTDLNSLFTTLGNSGVQLEQSDILKARLLNILQDQKFEYSKIWEACENMNNYFEKNIQDIFGFDTSKIKETAFSTYNPDVFTLKVQVGEELFVPEGGKSISQILENEEITTEKDDPKAKSSRCRSIIGFNALLIHTYRIYRSKAGEATDIDSFDTKKLLEIFRDFVASADADKVKEFFVLLWRVRYLLDKYIVKWRLPNTDLSDSYEEYLLLTKNTEQDTNFVRSNQAFSNLQMLQSVLYYNSGFTQQYWLTPYLNYLLEYDGETDLLTILEGIDNSMAPGSKKDSSWDLCKDIRIQPSVNVEQYLSKKLGTSFEHYWFYKLEYLLWKNWENKTDNKFVNYRITSKNSVEHVLSQKEEYKNMLTEEPDLLHSFGNLGLLSVGQNSEYSNQHIGKKMIDFKNKPTYDSLKLHYIYKSYEIDEVWDEVKIKDHAIAMINLLKRHYYPIE
ncbi:DUF262 domain-containing protein [Sphingobacterium siyangense]|uniref:DUF262 domain-containing protein n=1 Tax=Sphingobacterium siyangense TaxID=459529 RepID=UPI0019646DA8|nr:DUF262 domain-containing protein [Sphingobacterium siyangense]QRY55930.1 DUF262 domain-containing protein [Sphingobacterium siyangense]